MKVNNYIIISYKIWDNFSVNWISVNFGSRDQSRWLHLYTRTPNNLRTVRWLSEGQPQDYSDDQRTHSLIRKCDCNFLIDDSDMCINFIIITSERSITIFCVRLSRTVYQNGSIVKDIANTINRREINYLLFGKKKKTFCSNHRNQFFMKH